MNTLLPHARPPDWSKITMNHMGEADWFPGNVHVKGSCSLVLHGG